MKVAEWFESSFPDMPVFIGTDQPETCFKCGARTDFNELTSKLQLHHCSLCSHWYFVEFDDEEYIRMYES